MLNSHCNNNDKKNQSCIQLDANPRSTACKTTVLLTTLRSAVLPIDKKYLLCVKVINREKIRLFPSMLQWTNFLL